jgi:acetylornithine deacetylase/succinyl-diaminopimelate desuccinylase-like protein
MVDAAALTAYVDAVWDQDILPALDAYIRIPNKSPAFDPDWAAHGHMDAAVALLERWAGDRLAALPGARLEVVRLQGRTPVILIEIPGSGSESGADTVLLYGHLDKQPEMEGWSEGLGPWIPVLKGGKLYGRGGADDGYAMFASLTAILALAQQQARHARCVVLIEACEESGSFDLPAYVAALKDSIGRPSLVVCLDSGCGNYEQLWLTTSLRGLVGGLLTVEVLEHGVHSGAASASRLPASASPAPCFRGWRTRPRARWPTRPSRPRSPSTAAPKRAWRPRSWATRSGARCPSWLACSR